MMNLSDLETRPSDLLDERTTAALLGKSVAWLQRHRWAHTGPAFIKVGRSPRYRARDLLAYIERQRVETFSGNAA